MTFRKNIEKKDGFDSQVLDLTRVIRMTAGGRRFRFRAVVAAGDKKGIVGIGIAKGKDVPQAIEKATRKAKKNAIKVSINEGTILHQVESKFCSARVLLKPQKKGRGLVAGGVVRIICDLAGIKDISSKLISKTRNKHNIAMATIKALQELKS